jgi:hypothetical protein
MSSHVINGENEIDEALVVHFAGLVDDVLLEKSHYGCLRELNRCGGRL